MTQETNIHNAFVQLEQRLWRTENMLMRMIREYKSGLPDHLLPNYGELPSDIDDWPRCDDEEGDK